MIETQADELVREATDITFEDEASIETYSSLKTQHQGAYEEMARIMREPEHCLPICNQADCVHKNSKESWDGVR